MCRPADTVRFFQATPDGALAKKIRTEELSTLNMNGRIIEDSGVSLRRLLVKVDLTGCVQGGRLSLVRIRAIGRQPHRPWGHYSAISTECEARKSVYYGQSGKSGAYRVQKGHQTT